MTARATAVVRIEGDGASSAEVLRAGEMIRAGGLVAFPTETVYGLGANALDAAAVLRIFAAKGRPLNNPLIVHVLDALAARQVVADWPEKAERLARRFWPGPLSLVLPKHPRLPDAVTASGATVAVRAPAHPVARALLAAAGVPIAAPSANRSEGLSPTLASHVLGDLAGQVDWILDAGPTPAGLESTVLDLTRNPPRILRPGPIRPAEIEAVMGAIELADQPASPADNRPLPSPGLLPRHYAPRTPMELVDDDAARVWRLAEAGKRVGWLTFASGQDVPPGVVVRTMPTKADPFGAAMYAILHDLDRLGLDMIVVANPPAGEEWLAIRDRLTRAAAPTSLRS